MDHLTNRDRRWSHSGNEHFTGSVWNSRITEGEGGMTMIAVQFAPGARSDWHSHPAGQVLYVVSGSGLVQTDGGETRSITPGDVVYAPPGERHWHGARPDSPMLHLSLTTDGPTAWDEKVSDDEYGGAGDPGGGS